ncbi:MAG: hypothetical protein V1866_02660 [archaeon]
MKKKTDRKAQLQMGETVFVVFIIIIIILLGLVFYSKVREGQIKDMQRAQRVSNFISLAHTLSSWPELECSIKETRDFDCIDRVKLGILGDFINQSKEDNPYAFNYYNDLLRKSDIVVREIYPSQQSWTLYLNPGNRKTRDAISLPVNIYDPISKKYAFGVLELAVYE